jgi:hypothetical protein
LLVSSHCSELHCSELADTKRGMVQRELSPRPGTPGLAHLEAKLEADHSWLSQSLTSAVSEEEAPPPNGMGMGLSDSDLLQTAEPLCINV